MKKLLHIWVCLGCLWLCSCREVPKHPLVLLDFEAEETLDEILWRCHTLFSLSDDWAGCGNRSLKFQFFPSDYPGFAYVLHKKDWRGYDRISIRVFVPGKEPVELMIRIDDRRKSDEYGDRFNKVYRLNPGHNEVVIRLDQLITTETQRKMALKNIYQIMWFMVNPDQRHTLYFDCLRLDP